MTTKTDVIADQQQSLIVPEFVTKELSKTLATFSYGDLPPQVVAEAERAILDWLGSALAGANELPAQMVRKVVAGMGNSNESTIFRGTRSSAALAALANGVASHILEFDDVHKGSTLHGGAPIISSALAVAEREHADGRSFLLAVAVGYEAALRIGEAVNPSHYRFWHPTGTATTFGAAAAAGCLMKLAPEQMVNALGSAGTQAAGLWEFNSDGTMSKHLHAGKAAFNGILAADLARSGFTGASRILEGERGFVKAMSTSQDLSPIVQGLGEHWKIIENCYKLHSCCAHTHTAIDCSLEIRKERNLSRKGVLDNVSTISVKTYGPGFEIVKERNPRTPYQGKFSLAYCVAVALLEGVVGLQQFRPERFGSEGVRDKEIATVIDRIEVEVDENFSARYPGAWPATVTVLLRDGRIHTKTSDCPKGNPENPVSDIELERKFVSLVESRTNLETSEQALELLADLTFVPDMAGVFDGFGISSLPVRVTKEEDSR